MSGRTITLDVLKFTVSWTANNQQKLKNHNIRCIEIEDNPVTDILGGRRTITLDVLKLGIIMKLMSLAVRRTITLDVLK